MRFDQNYFNWESIEFLRKFMEFFTKDQEYWFFIEIINFDQKYWWNFLWFDGFMNHFHLESDYRYDLFD